VLQGGPESCLVRKLRVGAEIRARQAASQDLRTGVDAHRRAVFANEVYRAFKLAPVDDDFYQIAVTHLADGAASQRLGRNVADARTSGYSAEARVGDNGDVLAELEILERGGELVGFLHACAHGPAADEHQDVAGLDPAVLDRGDGGGLCKK